jgi:hypothetical protein
VVWRPVLPKFIINGPKATKKTKRVAKNRNLYDEMKNTDLDNFDIASNAKVIGDNNSQIDIDKIKSPGWRFYYFIVIMRKL